MKADADISDGDIAQDEVVTLGSSEVALVSGYGASGPNEDRNFAYALMDDGYFFYEFRLAGDPEFFAGFQQPFLDYVSLMTFDE